MFKFYQSGTILPNLVALVQIFHILLMHYTFSQHFDVILLITARCKALLEQSVLQRAPQQALSPARPKGENNSLSPSIGHTSIS